MQRVQSIQVLRFVAAALVIICHAWQPARIGAVGVDIFFVISGFIISRVMVGKTPLEFIRSRLTRIYPIYWICAVPTAIIATYTGIATTSRTLTSITLWPVFGPEYLQPYLVAGWTLSFEMLFYSSAAIVLIDRRALWAFAIAYPAATLGAVVTGAPALRFIGNPMVLEFLMGVAIGRSPTERVPRAGMAAIACAILLLAVSDASRLYLPRYVFELSATDRVWAWGVPAAMLVWGMLQLEGIDWRFFPYLGDASYSIYLAHGTAGFLFAIFPWPLRVVAALLFGVGVFHYVEKPLLKYIRRAALPRLSMQS